MAAPTTTEINIFATSTHSPCDTAAGTSFAQSRKRSCPEEISEAIVIENDNAASNEGDLPEIVFDQADQACIEWDDRDRKRKRTVFAQVAKSDDPLYAWKALRDGLNVLCKRSDKKVKEEAIKSLPSHYLIAREDSSSATGWATYFRVRGNKWWKRLTRLEKENAGLNLVIHSSDTEYARLALRAMGKLAGDGGNQSDAIVTLGQALEQERGKSCRLKKQLRRQQMELRALQSKLDKTEKKLVSAESKLGRRAVAKTAAAKH